MKNIFMLQSEYSNGNSEYNGVFSTQEKAENMLNFLKHNSLTEEVMLKRGYITTVSVEDEATSFAIDASTEFLIL